MLISDFALLVASLQVERELSGAVVHKKGGKQKRPADEVPKGVRSLMDEWDKWSRRRGVRMLQGLLFQSAEQMHKRCKRAGTVLALP